MFLLTTRASQDADRDQEVTVRLDSVTGFLSQHRIFLVKSTIIQSKKYCVCVYKLAVARKKKLSQLRGFFFPMRLY